MTEDDTFKALQKSPFEVLEAALDAYHKQPHWSGFNDDWYAGAEKIVIAHGWTPLEYENHPEQGFYVIR